MGEIGFVLKVLRKHFQIWLIVFCIGAIDFHLGQGCAVAANVGGWERSNTFWEEDWLLCALVEGKWMHIGLLHVLSKLQASLGSCLGCRTCFLGGMNMSYSFDSMEFSAIWLLLVSLQISKKEATFFIFFLKPYWQYIFLSCRPRGYVKETIRLKYY